MTHRIKCRGGEFSLRKGRLFVVEQGVNQWAVLHWNGTPDKSEPVNDWAHDCTTWGTAHCFLPIAWLACEAAHGTDDYTDALAHAAAVIDGVETTRITANDGPEEPTLIVIPGPSDMISPARIACDWMEERGWGFRCECEGLSPYRWSGNPDDSPEPTECDMCVNGSLRTIADWGRHLVETRCLTCGGRLDGGDHLVYCDDNETSHAERRHIVDATIGGKKVPRCPECTHPAHPAPPGLDIPTIVRTT